MQTAAETYKSVPSIGGFLSAIDLFGINEKSREKKLQERTALAQQARKPAYETLLDFLKDETTGSGLKSHKYALVKALLDFNHNYVFIYNDEQAKNLVALVHCEFERKITRIASEASLKPKQ